MGKLSLIKRLVSPGKQKQKKKSRQLLKQDGPTSDGFQENDDDSSSLSEVDGPKRSERPTTTKKKTGARKFFRRKKNDGGAEDDGYESDNSTGSTRSTSSTFLRYQNKLKWRSKLTGTGKSVLERRGDGTQVPLADSSTPWPIFDRIYKRQNQIRKAQAGDDENADSSDDDDSSSVGSSGDAPSVSGQSDVGDALVQETSEGAQPPLSPGTTSANCELSANKSATESDQKVTTVGDAVPTEKPETEPLSSQKIDEKDSVGVTPDESVGYSAEATTNGDIFTTEKARAQSSLSDALPAGESNHDVVDDSVNIAIVTTPITPPESATPIGEIPTEKDKKADHNIAASHLQPQFTDSSDITPTHPTFSPSIETNPPETHPASSPTSEGSRLFSPSLDGDSPENATSSIESPGSSSRTSPITGESSQPPVAPLLSKNIPETSGPQLPLPNTASKENAPELANVPPPACKSRSKPKSKGAKKEGEILTPKSIPRTICYSLRSAIGDGSARQRNSHNLMERRVLRPNGSHIDISHWSHRGKRSYMEDRYAVEHIGTTNKNSSDSQPITWLGIFDGHGGPAASQFCSDWLSSYLRKDVNFPSDLCAAIKSAFMKIDGDFVSTGNFDGSTACACAVVGSEKIICGNAGDSRAIIVKTDGSVVALSEDHKPGRNDETKRINEAGGRVIYWGRWRVEGILAVSRSIGDAKLKPYVTAEPDIVEHKIAADDLFLVMASDGVWDTMTSDLVAKFVLVNTCKIVDKRLLVDDMLLRWIARQISKRARENGSSDNVSCIVANLKSKREG